MSEGRSSDEQARELDWPDGIEELHAEPRRGWVRHASPAALVALAAVVVAAVFGVFGAEQTYSVESSGVRLEVDTPVRIRSGEFFEVRIRIVSDEPIDELVVGIDGSLWRDMTVNTFIPAPEEEKSDGNEFQFSFGPLEGGAPFEAKVDLQVNPDLVGTTEGAMRVYDGERLLVEVPMGIGVLP